MTDEAKALVEREGMQVLLPPASIDGDYLMGWLEGQSYLIENYGTDEASDKAFTVAHQVHRLQNLAETQAREIERLREDVGDRVRIANIFQAEADAEIDRLRKAVKGAREILSECKVSFGVCACGEDMQTHGTSHAPIDQAQVAVNRWLEEARAALGDSHDQ